MNSPGDLRAIGTEFVLTLPPDLTNNNTDLRPRWVRYRVTGHMLISPFGPETPLVEWVETIERVGSGMEPPPPLGYVYTPEPWG